MQENTRVCMKLPLHEIWQGDILYLLNVDSQGRRSRSNRLTELYNVFAVVKGLIGLQHKSAEHCVTDVTWLLGFKSGISVMS